jgi:threonine/homoserine/homoserine lactone efflux protein
MDFFKGLIFGMTLQLSVGPVCLSVLYLSISDGFKNAFKMALGVAIVDGFYIVISFLGVANLLRIEALRRVILILGACILIYFGLKYILNSKNDSRAIQGDIKSPLLHGMKLTFTNPLTIIFWSGIFGSLIASGQLHGIYKIVLYSAGCISSTIIFLSLVSLGGDFSSRILSPRLVKVMGYGVGVFLIFFGAVMLFKK